MAADSSTSSLSFVPRPLSFVLDLSLSIGRLLNCWKYVRHLSRQPAASVACCSSLASTAAYRASSTFPSSVCHRATKPRALVGAACVVIDQPLPERAAVRQLVVPRHPVEPQQQVLRRRRRRRPALAERRAVLTDVVAARGRAVEADAAGVGAVVVDRRPVGAPRIRVLRHRRVVVAANQVVQAQRHRVVDVGLVGVEQQRTQRLHDDRVAAPTSSESSPRRSRRRRHQGSTPAGQRHTSWPAPGDGRSSCGRCRCWRRRRFRCGARR